ncbi:MAG TPA: choice-of-anchor D domain-containing protein [Polyangiaceae bacterium]
MQNYFGLSVPGVLFILAAPAGTPGMCGPTVSPNPILRVDNGDTQNNTTFSFGRTPIGSATTRTVRFTNVSDVSATIAPRLPGILPAISVSPPFFRTGGSCVEGLSVIAAGQSCTLDISFLPYEVSHHDFLGYVDVDTDIGVSAAQFRLVGTGAYPGPSLTISDAPFYHFGTHVVGETVTKGFLVWSTGTEPAILETVNETTLGLLPPYRLVSTSCQAGAAMTPVRELSLTDLENASGVNLPPPITSFCALTVSFSPTSVALVPGRIRLSYKSSSGGLARVAVRDLWGVGAPVVP